MQEDRKEERSLWLGGGARLGQDDATRRRGEVVAAASGAGQREMHGDG